VAETTLKRGRGSSLAQTVSRFLAGIVVEMGTYLGGSRAVN